MASSTLNIHSYVISATSKESPGRPSGQFQGRKSMRCRSLNKEQALIGYHSGPHKLLPHHKDALHEAGPKQGQTGPNLLCTSCSSGIFIVLILSKNRVLKWPTLLEYLFRGTSAFCTFRGPEPCSGLDIESTRNHGKNGVLHPRIQDLEDIILCTLGTDTGYGLGASWACVRVPRVMQRLHQQQCLSALRKYWENHTYILLGLEGNQFEPRNQNRVKKYATEQPG